MKIATIVSSNSHIDYIARVVDAGEELPDASDHCFGQFVALQDDSGDVIGVIYDSRLVNPEYGGFGPRSGPRAELGKHNTNFVTEQGILIGILLLGTIDRVPQRLSGFVRELPQAKSLESVLAIIKSVLCDLARPVQLLFKPVE